MRIHFSIAALAGALAIAASPSSAQAQSQSVEDSRDRQEERSLQRDQDRAYDKVRNGRAMPLPLIERAIVPRMRGYQYLGPEERGDVYRLKFVREGRVVWIDVDPRTGRIVGRSRR